MSDSKSSGLLGGMIIGGALGAIAGILVAPRTGKETRRILKKSADALPELAEDLATSIQFQADRLSEGSLSNWDQTLMRLREAVVAGRAASRQEWVRSADGFTTADDDTSPEMRAQSATSQDAASDIIDD
ncbi:MAG: YtxH domain-containing protein [Cyanobacteria bacterium J06621_3]